MKQGQGLNETHLGGEGVDLGMGAVSGITYYHR